MKCCILSAITPATNYVFTLGSTGTRQIAQSVEFIFVWGEIWAVQQMPSNNQEYRNSAGPSPKTSQPNGLPR